MNKDMLCEVLKSHTAWLCGNEGERADLSGVDLKGIDLSRANLSDADLCGVNLSMAKLYLADLSDTDLCDASLCWTNLRMANLNGANLNGADLRGADLSNADLRNTDLSGADISGANLSGALLNGADLSGIVYDLHTAFYTLQCPEEGSFVGYKKAHGYIIKMEILADAKRSSATSRICRCNAAKVLSITSIDGKTESSEVFSDYDSTFVYRTGEMVRVDDFDDDRWNECSTGIHFFLTRKEAELYRRY